MSVTPGISAFAFKPAPTVVIPPPSIRFNDGFLFSLSEGVRDDAAQRARIVTDICDIYTTNGFITDISVNWGWSEAETTLGNYQWVKPLLAKAMAQSVNATLGLSETAGCKWWIKIFFRTYRNATQSAIPSVPPYMQSPGATYAGTYGGTGSSSNGEYYAGSGGNTNSANAKLMVPAVADRLEALLKEIGAEFNDDLTFAGVIINETSILGALPGETGMTVNPGTHLATYTIYLQNLFNAMINARASLNKCELIISPNNPQEVFTLSPINATTLFDNHKIGFYIQDAYKVPPSKFSVDNIYAKTQPYFDKVSGMYNLSGEVSSHKADSATNTPGYPLLETIDYAINTNNATHMVFQVNATSGTSSNAIRYQDEVNILKTIGYFPRSIRPIKYT